MKQFYLLQIILILLCFNAGMVYSQSPGTISTNVLSFEEFIGQVKRHHPLIRQADLQLGFGEAELLKARGSFDPKVEVDYDRKDFKGTEYYDELNATFKIPTWYGLEFKANFEENTGEFLDPSLTVPDGGLYSAGVSLSLAKGLLMNDRMATLKKAKLFREQTKAERELLINQILYEASQAYLGWLEAYNEQEIYRSFLENAEVRFRGIKRSVETGEKAPIDSIEAKITLQDRFLNLEAAGLKTTKASLELSNYLWLEDVPLELKETVVPMSPNPGNMAAILRTDSLWIAGTPIEEHPKLRSLDLKLESLRVDRALKRNQLLPQLDVEYNFITEDASTINSLDPDNYKAGLTFNLPLFLRKERGALKLANLKLRETNFERASATVSLQNKIEAANREIISLGTQNELVAAMVNNYRELLRAEERKFYLGESSLFLVNSREQKLIDAQLKANMLTVKALEAQAGLLNAIGRSPISPMGD
ncbi:TolC family protein [Zeaxanthinibacter enoshimensis]|uniref:Outer membrane protein TolC n=1 Tax=Zeaxanthinibacter enoshimensis TaxID=392009 RepID=A0A4R6TH10_9FLAO|nr:TolC family protein [Zeaxanthinibacter enoshimensis]TDQ29143.1 outer membrane protein TolC [Zeaxanthinibacter enoshimensis]